MKKINIILVGGGGHARACADVINISKSNFNIVGYVDPKENKQMSNLKYLGNDEVLIDYVENSSFLITIGQIKSYNKRKELFDHLVKNRANMISIYSGNSYVSSNALVGVGTIVMHGVIVQTNVKIGKNCIINDRALIEHDSVIGDNCHISTGAIINGDCKIGNGVFIGSSAVIRNEITIADNCIIGMGAIVKYDVLPNSKTIN